MRFKTTLMIFNREDCCPTSLHSLSLGWGIFHTSCPIILVLVMWLALVNGMWADVMQARDSWAYMGGMCPCIPATHPEKTMPGLIPGKTQTHSLQPGAQPSPAEIIPCPLQYPTDSWARKVMYVAGNQRDLVLGCYTAKLTDTLPITLRKS